MRYTPSVTVMGAVLSGFPPYSAFFETPPTRPSSPERRALEDVSDAVLSLGVLPFSSRGGSFFFLFSFEPSSDALYETGVTIFEERCAMPNPDEAHDLSLRIFGSRGSATD